MISLKYNLFVYTKSKISYLCKDELIKHENFDRPSIAHANFRCTLFALHAQIAKTIPQMGNRIRYHQWKCRRLSTKYTKLNPDIGCCNNMVTPTTTTATIAQRLRHCFLTCLSWADEFWEHEDFLHKTFIDCVGEEKKILNIALLEPAKME